MTLEEIQYKAQSIMQEWKDDDSAPYVEFVEELASMNIEHPSDDLEKEIERFLASEESSSYVDAGNYKVAIKDPMRIALHFTEWKKEQMMKDAVDAEVHPDDCEIWCNTLGYGYDFKEGEKVKIIIVKED